MTRGQQDGVTSVDGGYRPSNRHEQLRRLLRLQRAADELATAQLLERRTDSGGRDGGDAAASERHHPLG